MESRFDDQLASDIRLLLRETRELRIDLEANTKATQILADAIRRGTDILEKLLGGS